MTKQPTWILFLFCLLGMVGVIPAEEENRFRVEWDTEAVEKMSKTERLAYQLEYKAALETAARKAGAIPSKSKARQPSGRQALQPSLVPGHGISYHSGTLFPSSSLSVAVGNHFDTALTWKGDLGPVALSGSITMLTADMARVGGGDAFITIYDQLNGTTAHRITSRLTPMVAGLNTITLPTAIPYVGSSFLAGVWNFSPGSDTVHLATGTVSGQGFHGMSINDGDPGTGFNAFTMTNGTVSIQGDRVLTPVELMSFSID